MCFPREIRIQPLIIHRAFELVNFLFISSKS